MRAEAKVEFNPTKQLNELCSAAAEGRLDIAQAEELNATLRNDAEARQFYIDYMEVNALLGWRHGAVEPLELPLAAPAKAEIVKNAPRNRWVAAASLAGLAIAALVMISVLALRAWQGSQPTPIAIVLDEDDVRWQHGAAVDAQHQIRPGRHRIEAGVARIELFNGVLLTAAGPVDFELNAADHVHLHRGKLHIYSPLATRGFTVTTPRGVQIVDLGTRFGVWANDADEVHVHLYEGRLRINGRKEIEAGAAVVVDAQGQLQQSEANEELFPPLHRE